MIDGSESKIILAGDFRVIMSDLCSIEGVLVEFLVVVTVGCGDGDSDGDGESHAKEYFCPVDYYKGGECSEVKEECPFGRGHGCCREGRRRRRRGKGRIIAIVAPVVVVVIVVEFE